MLALLVYLDIHRLIDLQKEKRFFRSHLGESLQLDDSPSCSLSHCLGSTFNPKFVEYMDDMGFHGAFADDEFIRDLFIRSALRDELKHLHLPRRENFLGGRGVG